MRNRAVVTLEPADLARAEAMVLAMDPHWIAFDKPAGLACQTRAIGDDSLDRLLWAFARSNGKRPNLVHRLDRETSGVILAARTKPAAAALHAAFEARSVRKTYLALVRVEAALPPRGRITAPLAGRRTGALSYSAVVDPQAKGAREAVTVWRCLDRRENAALLSVRPETGRMHQIRAHLAHIGLPLFGDGQYGSSAAATGANRTLLHALSLDFPGPAGGRHTVSAPPPADLRAAASALGLLGGLEALAEAS